MNKLTDAEIVKALEICTNEETDLCNGCPCLVDDCCTGYHNREDFLTMVLDLINRQKAEKQVMLDYIRCLEEENKKQKAEIEELKADKIIAKRKEDDARKLYKETVVLLGQKK